MLSMGVVSVRDIKRADLPSVHAILEEWLRDPRSGEVLPGEVDQRIETIASTIAGHPTRQFVVAINERGELVGVAGLQSDTIEPELCTGVERPVEIVTSYVRRDTLGTGVGRALLDELESRARTAGFTTVLVVSGSRNREHGYPFWARRYGDPYRWDHDFFGPGQERVVWRTPL